MSAAHGIEARGLVKHFGDKVALAGVDLSVASRATTWKSI